MAVAPLQDRGTTIPIIDVVREAKGLNLDTPLLIRFQDLLRHATGKPLDPGDFMRHLRERYLG